MELEQMSVKELLKLAKEAGLSVPKNAKKSEILALLSGEKVEIPEEAIVDVKPPVEKKKHFKGNHPLTGKPIYCEI